MRGQTVQSSTTSSGCTEFFSEREREGGDLGVLRCLHTGVARQTPKAPTENQLFFQQRLVAAVQKDKELSLLKPQLVADQIQMTQETATPG